VLQPVTAAPDLDGMLDDLAMKLRIRHQSPGHGRAGREAHAR
jgi:hypothetical protein